MTDEELMALVAAEQIASRSRFQNGGRLVHYTSAEAAYKIVKGAQVWLRSASVMNDFSEIKYGLDCLQAGWASPGGLALQAMLERLRPGMANELVEIFNYHTDSLRVDTYIASLSEHDDEEDELGRLSMWRAYGGRAGVALVLNSTAFTTATEAIKAFSAPVSYFTISEFVAWFQIWTGRLIVNEAALASSDLENVRNALFQAFRILALCTKHRGFREEREWRVFTSPVHEGGSPWLDYQVETIHGIPQPLAKPRLFDDAAAGVVGVEPKALLSRVIIGPCDYPLQVRKAMLEAMTSAGVGQAEDKIWMSLIPLRQS